MITIMASDLSLKYEITGRRLADVLRKAFLCSLTMLAVVLGFASCIDDKYPTACSGGMDCEVSVSVSVNTSSKVMGDPGMGHDEDSGDYWVYIDLYLVYTNGHVVRWQLTRDDYENNNPVTFTTLEGSAKVYAVAYGKEHTAAVAANVDEVKNLKTSPVTAISGNAARREYMLSLFSGVSADWQVIDAEQQTTYFSVTLHRLVSKVDVQWDVQDAYENGAYVEASMGSISLNGAAESYFFPDEATDGALQEETGLQTYVNAPDISDRNGRTYFYAFPGQCSFDFSINYTPGSGGGELSGEKRYKGTFPEMLQQASWYKVNVTVKGTVLDTTGGLISMQQ